MRADMATKSDVARIDGAIADLRSDLNSLGANIASDIHELDAKITATRKDLSEQTVGLLRAVMEYHSSAVGHGLLFSELEDRVRRIEQRLGMESHS